MNASPCAPVGTIKIPGFVQNWPDPRVAESIAAFARSAAFSARTFGEKNTGFKLPISAYTGIGTSRFALISIRIFPTFPEPVKPIAVISGWLAIQ